MSIASEVKAAPHVYGPPVVVEVKVTVKALAFREADGGYSVVVPELAGCVTQGETIEEVEMMVRDLADMLLDMKHDEERERAIHDLTSPLDGEAIS